MRLSCRIHSSISCSVVAAPGEARRLTDENKTFQFALDEEKLFFLFWFSEFFFLFRFFSFPLSVLLKRRRLEGELHATQTVFVSITLLVRRNLLTVLISILMHGCWRRALDEETFPIFLAAQLDNLSRFTFCLPITINFFGPHTEIDFTISS